MICFKIEFKKFSDIGEELDIATRCGPFNQPREFKMKKLLTGIDWRTQIVAFIGTILGIIIAFQLEDRQEQNIKEERLRTAIENLNREIAENLKNLESTKESNETWTGYLNFLIGKRCENQELALMDNELDSLRKIYPIYFKENRQILNLIVKKVIKKDYKLYQICYFNAFKEAAIVTDNWEAAKQSGVFLTMNPTQILYYTQIYRHINIMTEQRVKNYYWSVNEVDSRKFDELIRINGDANNYLLQISNCIDSIKDLGKSK